MSETDFDRICRDSNDIVSELTHEARKLIMRLDPEVVEVIWAQQKIAGYGIGPKKMTEQYVYLSPFKAHLNFGFYRGVLLDDQVNMLQGSGKDMRHIKLRSKEDLDNPDLIELIKQARAERISALRDN